MTLTNTISSIYVGVDVSKAHLDVCLWPLNQSFQIANTIDGMKKFLEKLKPYNVEQVVCEATGGYDFLMLKMLRKAKYKTWQVEPNRIKSFIRSEGQKAKNDKIDARMIALFASQKKNPYPEIEISHREEFQELQSLVIRREELVGIRKEEVQRLGAPQPNLCKKLLKKHIAFLDDEIVQIEQAINVLVEKDKEFNHKVTLMESVPGIGRTTAATLLAYVPELGTISNKSIAALIGVAPYTHQSGQFTGKAFTSGGRAEPRAALYMPAMASTRYNPVIKSFYQHLKDMGKLPKVALVAVMRKIIVILNTMLRNNEKWEPDRESRMKPA